MKTFILCVLSLLLFACNSEQDNAANLQSENVKVQQKRIDSLKSSATITTKTQRDSLKKIKLNYWKKQATLMSVSLSADKAMLNKAQQTHLFRSKEKRDRDIAEAETELNQDKKRFWQINDSLKRYQ